MSFWDDIKSSDLGKEVGKYAQETAGDWIKQEISKALPINQAAAPESTQTVAQSDAVKTLKNYTGLIIYAGVGIAVLMVVMFGLKKKGK